MPSVAQATQGVGGDEEEEPDDGDADDESSPDLVPRPPRTTETHRTTGEVSSVAHQACHSPAAPKDGCEDCMVGSKREAPYVPGRSTREVPEEFVA